MQSSICFPVLENGKKGVQPEIFEGIGHENEFEHRSGLQQATGAIQSPAIPAELSEHLSSLGRREANFSSFEPADLLAPYAIQKPDILPARRRPARLGNISVAGCEDTVLHGRLLFGVKHLSLSDRRRLPRQSPNALSQDSEKLAFFSHDAMLKP
ncbi:hypothetical protein ABHV46_08135 [Asaia sp. BMEF1]|uniref:hypothetical protein n=1 Tax=Asaia sp. BMEF1 TaxID=3155932 RepID=UPI003F66AC81